MKIKPKHNIEEKYIELLKTEPVLTGEKDLHQNIMLAVKNTNQLNSRSGQKQFLIRMVRRSLKAAAVLLILIFGYEQYMVTSSILRLESKISSNTPESAISLKTKLLFNIGTLENYSGLNKVNFQAKKSDLGNRIKLARISAFIQENIPQNQIKSIGKNIEL